MMAPRELGFRVTKPLAKWASSGQSVSPNILNLKKGGRAAKSSSYLKSLRTASASDLKRPAYGEKPVDNLLSAEYIAEISWDGIPVNVIIDTGSSDSWLVQNGFTCVDQNHRVQTRRCTVSGQLRSFTDSVNILQQANACLALHFRAHLTTQLSRTSTSI